MTYAEQPFLHEVSRPLASKNWPKELQFSALDVAHTAWAFAALLSSSESLLKELEVATVEVAPEFRPQCVANSA